VNTTRVFMCPHTGQRVQGWFVDDGETYQGVSCLACNQPVVNLRTGHVLGADEE
jgi:DNA-binding IclR family transcriptional regulator